MEKFTPFVFLAIPPDVDAAVLQPTADTLRQFGVSFKEAVFGDDPGTWPEQATRLAAREDGGRISQAVIVASADSRFPATLAAYTRLPVLRVPVEHPEMAARGPGLFADLQPLPTTEVSAAFATFAIGKAGATNAALFVVAMLAVTDARLRAALHTFRSEQTAKVLSQELPLAEELLA